MVSPSHHSQWRKGLGEGGKDQSGLAGLPARAHAAAVGMGKWADSKIEFEVKTDVTW